MKNNQLISDEVLDTATVALSNGKHWMAYNQSLYFIDKTDVCFFNSKTEATIFAKDNYSDRDNYHVIFFNSMQDILRRIPYWENLINFSVNEPEVNGLFNHEDNPFTHSLSNRIENQQSLFNKQLKTTIMNIENLEYLDKQLKFTGFGERHHDELKSKMEVKMPEFQITHSHTFGKDEMSATLYFKKSSELDMYFFNKYDASMKVGSDTETIKQTYYINREGSITFKEAYNLMNGRAVNKDLTSKEGEKYNAWVQLDFKETDNSGNFKVKQFHQNYGYNLEQALLKLPIKEMATDTDKLALIHSLQKGNLQAVTYLLEGKEQRQFIEANPQFKSISVFDVNMRPVNSQVETEKESLGQSSKQHSKKNAKTGDDEGGPVAKKVSESKRKRGMSAS